MGQIPRPLRGLTTSIVFVAAATTTVWWCASMGSGMRMPGGWSMSMAWMRMSGQSWAGAAIGFVAMWALMMIAMMLPSLAPVLLRHRRPVRVACAYFGVWTAAGIVIYPLGLALAAAEMHWFAVSRLVPLGVGVVIAAAGLVQLSRWKARMLAHCRDRACCAVGRRPGPRQAWRDGLRLGVRCVLCCAAPFAVLIVVGVMNIAVMALITVAITAERIVPRPWRLVRSSGVVAVVVGAILAMAWVCGWGT